MMYYYNNFLPFHMFGFGFIVMILFWVCVTYGLLFFLRYDEHLRKAKQSSSISSALEIVKERYVRGEITKDEFISIKQDIS